MKQRRVSLEPFQQHKQSQGKYYQTTENKHLLHNRNLLLNQTMNTFIPLSQSQKRRWNRVHRTNQVTS